MGRPFFSVTVPKLPALSFHISTLCRFVDDFNNRGEPILKNAIPTLGDSCYPKGVGMPASTTTPAFFLSSMLKKDYCGQIRVPTFTLFGNYQLSTLLSKWIDSWIDSFEATLLKIYLVILPQLHQIGQFLVEVDEILPNCCDLGLKNRFF